MFNALSAIKSAAANVAARLFDLKVEKAPAPAPKPANGNGHHVVAVIKPVVALVVEAPKAEPEDDEDEFEQGQCPALGLEQVVAQAAAQAQLPAATVVEEALKAEAVNDVGDPLVVSRNADLDILAAAMADSGFERPAPASAVVVLEEPPPPAETPKVEVEEAKPVVVAKKPALPVDARPECKLVTCGEKFSPPNGYTRGYCRACDPDGWAFQESRKASTPTVTKTTRVCGKVDCQRDFVPPAQYPFARHCPSCHAKDVAERKALSAKRQEADRLAEEARRVNGVTEAQNKEQSKEQGRTKAEEAKQLRLQAQGCPNCPTCKKYFEPLYVGARYCQPCANEYKRSQETAMAKAEADRKAKIAADKALAEQGFLTEAERARRFEALKSLFVAGKEMPEGVTLVRSGTQIVFTQDTKVLKDDGTPKKLSFNGHCPLTARELADAEARKAEAEATKRAEEAKRAEAERIKKALEAKKKDLAERYLSGTLPEGTTAESIMEAGEGKKAEARPKVRFIFADGTAPLVIDPPVKETKKDKSKDDGSKGKKKGKK